MAEKDRILISKVEGKMAEDGRPRYTIYDKFDNRYSSRKRDIGNAAKKLEGHLVEIEFIKNGKFRNLVSIKAAPESAKKEGGSQRNYDKDREGMSFGNARACAATIIAALIGTGYYGDLSDKKDKTNFELSEVIEDHTEATKLMESSRPGAETVSKEDNADTPSAFDEGDSSPEPEADDDKLFN